MASKFGGIAVDESAPKKSKFGGIAVSEPAAAPATATTQPETQPYQRQASWGEVARGAPYRAAAGLTDLILNTPENLLNLGKMAYGTAVTAAGRPDLAPTVTAPTTPVTTALQTTGAIGYPQISDKELTTGQRIADIGLQSAFLAPVGGGPNALRSIALGGGAGTVGQATTEATGSPLLGLTAAVLTGKTPKGKVTGATAIEDLKTQSDALRTQMYATGQTFDPTALKQSVKSGVESATPEFPVGGAGVPNTQAALDQIDRLIATGAQVRIDQLEHVNSLLNDAVRAGGRDKIYALKAKEKLNAFALALGGETGALWKAARELETKQFRSQDIKDIVASAEKSDKATSSVIRKEFQKINDDKNEMGLYTPEQQAIIKQIADGTVTQKTLEFIGKMAPKSVGYQRILSLLGFGGAATYLGGPVGTGAVLTAYGVGAGARGAANQLAKSRVNMLDELIRGGQMPQTISIPQQLRPTVVPSANFLLQQQGQQ
jgi:hypothetical protein